jgi:hypothetical protein
MPPYLLIGIFWQAKRKQIPRKIRERFPKRELRVLHFRPILCAPFGCTASTFCAYHGNTTTSAGDPAIYAYMPQDNSLGSGCQSGVGTSPNNQVVADQEIAIMRHEFFESVSDPLIAANQVAWTGPSGEIGDNCDQETGSV